MLFNSHVYILAFLPAVLLVYFTLSRMRLILAGKTWLVFSSLFFYSYWNPVYLPLILSSMFLNYGLGSVLAKTGSKGGAKRRKVRRKSALSLGIVLNLGFLGYYKYADFFLDNLNSLSGSDFPALNLVLPLAISFFTFQQIAYLVDSYKGETVEYDFLNYCLFVTFFPQLIAGPIVHHGEMMPQFARVRSSFLNWRNIATGLMIFSMGLFKKVFIADNFAVWATAGFDQALSLSFLEAWAASLSYSFQLYYDFSGYTDMAIGSALLFNIKLPLNFNSPYKAVNIQDFWRRWHMTLSRWLRDYIYIPLGGNRRGEAGTYCNLFLTFLLGGLWHGAGWTFVLWGAMHGLGTALHKFWQGAGLRMPKWAGWLTTFLFVNFSWVFFRAQSFEDAMKVFRGLFGLSGFVLPEKYFESSAALQDAGFQVGEALRNIDGGSNTTWMILLFGLIAFCGKNSMEIGANFRPNGRNLLFAVVLFMAGFLSLSRMTDFLYFNF